MKITATQYAQALHEMTAGKTQPEIDAAAANLVKTIVKNGQAKLFSKIREKFAEIYNRENGIVEAEITSREELSDELRKHLRKYVSNKYGAKEVVLKEKVDEKIKGGIIIRVGDEVLDNSVSRILKELENKLTC